jgi:hypothetical protein
MKPNRLSCESRAKGLDGDGTRVLSTEGGDDVVAVGSAGVISRRGGAEHLVTVTEAIIISMHSNLDLILDPLKRVYSLSLMGQSELETRFRDDTIPGSLPQPSWRGSGRSFSPQRCGAHGETLRFSANSLREGDLFAST